MLRGDEGRGWLRKAPGSCQPDVDPEVSEWGNPPLRIATVPRPEFIGPEERTRGSETSQYPEEKKTTSDSRSSGERTGRNEPKPRSRKCPRGCGSAVGPPKASGSAWKGAPECVIAAYAKARGGRAGYPSKAGHVQSCLNLPGPSGKAKYY